MITSRPSDTFQPGDVLNTTYRIEKILGRGGTSEVYRARSEINDRVVALKVLSSEFSINDDYLALMKREEEIRDVLHDAVVRYSEISRTPDGHVYLLMDYVQGPSLDEKLKSGGMSADDLMVIAGRVCEGLVAIHARNIVHRDLSPDNILLRGGEPGEAVIIDFGIAKDANPGAATIVGNEFAGKYAYAAPEQLSGNSDARSDIYALGALLLATFRGKSPIVGKNPMEVIEIKAKPLDTEGVPEPFRSLLDKMTHPDPEDRFQSAQDVLGDLAPQFLGTVVVGQNSIIPKASAPKSSQSSAPETKPRKKRSGIFAVLGLVVLLLAGAGAYVSGALDGFITPPMQVADPYILIAEGGRDGSPNVTGYVPNEITKSALEAKIADAGGVAELNLASGNIHDNWAVGVQYLIENALALDEWRVSVEGNTFRVSGLSNDAQLRDIVLSNLQNREILGGFSGSIEVLLGPRILSTSSVEQILQNVADCGSLSQSNPPDGGYPIGSSIIITGKLSSTQTRGRLFDALDAVAGDRKILIGADVLSTDECHMGGFLSRYATGDFQIIFSNGLDNSIVPSGQFAPGQNPAIDVVIPASVVDGFIWVSIVDVSGNVFHLLPNTNRKENSIANLRNGSLEQLDVRVAYGFREATGDSSKIAFNVDNTLGESKILIFHSSAQLFENLRPVSESLASFTEALSSEALNSSAQIHSLDHRDLITIQ